MIMSFSKFEGQNATEGQVGVGLMIESFLNDIGVEDTDVVLEFDEPDSDFDYLLSGTNLSLSFDEEGIHVTRFENEQEGSILLESFNHDELNKATLWLVTQANLVNYNS